MVRLACVCLRTTARLQLLICWPAEPTFLAQLHGKHLGDTSCTGTCNPIPRPFPIDLKRELPMAKRYKRFPESLTWNLVHGSLGRLPAKVLEQVSSNQNHHSQSLTQKILYGSPASQGALSASKEAQWKGSTQIVLEGIETFGARPWHGACCCEFTSNETDIIWHLYMARYGMASCLVLLSPGSHWQTPISVLQNVCNAACMRQVEIHGAIAQ